MNNSATVFVLGEGGGGRGRRRRRRRRRTERKGVKRAGSVSVSRQLPTYPSPDPTTVY